MNTLLLAGAAMLLTTSIVVAQPAASLQSRPTAPAGSTYQTPNGAQVGSGGGNGVQTAISPSGGTSIVQSNGNGTSTLTSPGGSINSAPTPR